MSRYCRDVAVQSCEVPGWFTCAESYGCTAALPKGLGVYSPTCCVVKLSSIFNVPDLCVPQDSSEVKKSSSFCSFLFLLLVRLLAPRSTFNVCTTESLRHTLQSVCSPAAGKHLIHGCLVAKSFDILKLVDHPHLRKKPYLLLFFY